MSRALRCFLLLSTTFTLIGGCKAKPSEEACRAAINNIRLVSGQDTADVGADPKAAIRSCRANSSKKSVQCMRDAKSLVEVKACEGEEGSKYFEQAQDEKQKRLKKATKKDSEGSSKEE